MTNSPMFSKMDADRILRRAAEIEGSEESGPVTVDEIRSIAGEAGFGSQAIDRAIVEAQQASSNEARHDPVQRSGLLITHLWSIRSIPIQISSDQLMKAVRLFQPYRDGPAPVTLGEHQITWRDHSRLRFTVMSAGGVTEVRVNATVVFLAKRRWIKFVSSAADRLEALVFLVAHRSLPGTQELGALPARSQLSAAGPEH